MWSQASWIDSAPRIGAAAISIAAIAWLGQTRPTAFPSPSIAAVGVAAVLPNPKPVSWDVRTGGWRIRLDDVALAFPSAEELISSDPTSTFRLTLSKYDELIARHAEAEGFDWRLIAAVIFEESRFDPNIVSSKGAFGLMQVREIAARDVGERHYWVPEDNVRAGVRYLSSLLDQFDGARKPDRLRLALAAYNVGPAHLRDAQQLAGSLGLDPLRWEGGVRETLPLLERPKIYTRLPYGFAQGTVTVGYVERVWARFLEYQRATAAFAATERSG